MAKKQSLEYLIQIIDEVSSEDTHMLFRNSFALSCYLMEIGEERAAKKSLSYLFSFLGKNNRQTYFSGIMISLKEYSSEYAREISANVEINELFKEKA